jgi:hypothetical protein
MSRVKLEIWDNADNIQVAEVEHIDPREAFERAVRMARAALPRTTEVNLEPGTYEMKLDNVHFNDATQTLLFGQVASDVQAGRYQVRFNNQAASAQQKADGRCPQEAPGRGRGNRCALEGNHGGQHVGEVDGWRWSDPDPVPTQAGEPTRKPCGQPCRASDSEGEDESCSDTCAKPQGHVGWHETSDQACTWAYRADSKPRPTLCTGVCEFGCCWESCARPLDHENDGCYCTIQAHREAIE